VRGHRLYVSFAMHMLSPSNAYSTTLADSGQYCLFSTYVSHCLLATTLSACNRSRSRIAKHGLMRSLSCKGVLLAAAPVPELAIPDNIRHRQATQTIATAPEPNAWLVRTEWPAQMAALQHGAKHPEQQTPVPRDMHATNAEELQPCFADPVKGSVMSLADCQAKYPHMQLVSQWCCQPGA